MTSAKPLLITPADVRAAVFRAQQALTALAKRRVVASYLSNPSVRSSLRWPLP